MSVVWKFPLPRALNDVPMPSGAQVLAVAWQGFYPTLWALVDSSAQPETRRFGVIATGQAFDAEGATYHGTTFAPDGTVWHIWEAATPGGSAT